MAATKHEAQQHEAFIRLCEAILKLGRWRDFLTRPQSIAPRSR